MADGNLDGLILEWKRRWDLGEETRSLEGPVVAAARPIALKAARARRLHADIEDAAQEVCLRLLRHLQEGKPVRGRPESFVWSIAVNLGTDIHRARTRKRSGQERMEEAAKAVAPVADGEAKYLTAEGQREAKVVVERLLQQAPENYARVLRMHYVEELPLEEIATRYYQEDVEAGTVDTSSAATTQDARKRARNRVDQHHKRGLLWMQKRLAEEGAEP